MWGALSDEKTGLSDGFITAFIKVSHVTLPEPDDPIRTFESSFSKVWFNIFLPCTSRAPNLLFPWDLSNRNICAFLMWLVCFLPVSFPWFGRRNSARCRGDSYRKIKKNYTCNRPWRPIGLWDVEAPTFSRQSAHRWRWGCQPHAPATLYSQEDSWYSFLLEAESTPGP
jgi:hypothetical protein